MSDTEIEQEQEVTPVAQEATETPEDQPQAEDPTEDDLPEWVKKKIRKANEAAAKHRVEAKTFRDQLQEQEPLVAAAQEAERAKMTELDRERADNKTLKDQLALRDSELLMVRYQIPNEYAEFIGEGSFEEKEARAQKVGEMVQSKNGTQDRPPSDRPVESLKPGASPSTPPLEDHSYPAGWGFQTERA